MIYATSLLLAIVGQVVLPGSRMELQQATTEARAIVVAEIARPPMIIGAGNVWYTAGFELRTSRVLKGHPDEGTIKNVGMSGTHPETVTEPGQRYVFLLGEYEGKPRVLKVVPNSEPNLAAIRAMVD